MAIGMGYTDRRLTESEARSILHQAFGTLNLSGRRVLVIIPDGTRTAPIDRMFRLIHDALAGEVAALDILIALGTHAPMTDAQINERLGWTPVDRAGRYQDVKVFNHRWDLPETFRTIGRITPAEALELTDGLLEQEVPIRINKLIFDYDQVIICGPTFPHEVVGFSGGNKYLFPGISGSEIIDFFHWLGALKTTMAVIGTKHTPMRRVVDRAASFIDVPIYCLSLVVKEGELAGLYAGDAKEAWSDAADLSSELHVVWLDRPFDKVLSMPSAMYDDLWTAAKAMYKTEPIVADGGEVIIYQPALGEISYTHGKWIDQVGYHVKDYFTKQPDRFREVPGGVKAHSTHVKGVGSFDPATGSERPRIEVSLATAIPKARTLKVNLGYRDPAGIDLAQWEGRERDGILVVHHAGETLYRLKSQRTAAAS